MTVLEDSNEWIQFKNQTTWEKTCNTNIMSVFNVTCTYGVSLGMMPANGGIYTYHRYERSAKWLQLGLAQEL